MMSVELDYRSHILSALNVISRFVDPAISDRNFTDGRLLRDSRNREIADNSGGNAVIFKFELANGDVCALRLFKNFPVIDDRIQRLSPVSDALGRIRSPILTSYRFFNPGLHLANADDEIKALGVPFVTPILLMGWVDGVSLGKYVKSLCEAKETDELTRLFHRWIALVREMRRIGLAHGDITASNIMVRNSDKELVLVDYDDLYLPGMDDVTRKVEGTPGYRHPKQKNSRAYGPRMDDFSLLVMTVSLAVLAERPEDFRSIDNLFFRKGDLENTNSEAFEKAKRLWNADAKPFVQSLIRACAGHVDDPVVYDEIVFGKEIAEFETGLGKRDRIAVRSQAGLIRNLSIWSQYEGEYSNIVNRTAEKSRIALELLIASGHADWIREELGRQNIRSEDLPPDLRQRLPASFGAV